jgi:hypothetical protein
MSNSENQFLSNYVLDPKGVKTKGSRDADPRITLMQIRIRLFTWADPDPAFHFNADPDPDPALFQGLNF